MGEMRNSHKIFIGKLEYKILLAGPDLQLWGAKGNKNVEASVSNSKFRLRPRGDCPSHSPLNSALIICDI
jgi:hypothetical protein